MQKLGSHWSHNYSDAVILAHPDGSLGLTIKGGSDFGEFPYLGELKQERIRYQGGLLSQDDIILEIQGQQVAGFTQRDVVLWLKHCSANGTPVTVRSVRGGFLPKDLKEYLASVFQKGSLDHELQNTIRDNLYMRTVPCTTREPREGEQNGQDYWFMSQDEFNELERAGHLLESGFHNGNYYGTPKPPHTPLEGKSDSISELVRSGANPSSEGKRRRNLSNVEALNAEMLREDSWDRGRNGRMNTEDIENRPENMDHHFVAPAKKQDGGMWGNIAAEAVAKSRHLDSGHQSEDESSARKYPADDLPEGWEKVDDPVYGTYYIDHINRRTQYDHPMANQKAPAQTGYSSSTFPRIKKKDQGQVPKSTSSNMGYGGVSRNITADMLQGDFIDVNLIKGVRGLGFTVIGGESKYPNADFEDDDRSWIGTLLQLKSIAPGGAAQMDGRLRPGDVLVQVNDKKVLGFTHDQVIQLFQSIQPGEQVLLRVCRGYPLPPDATDPRTQVITTDISSMGSGGVGTFSRSKSNYEMKGYGSEDMGHGDNTDQEVAAAFADGTSYASGPTYRLQMTKGPSGFGFTIAESPDGQIIKKINDKKRCQGLLEGDLLVEINGNVVRGLDHTAVVEVLKEAPTDYPSHFIVQRAQRIEGRKEQRQSRFLGRSKTPTAEMYKTNNGDSSKKQRSKTPTPRSSSSLFGFFRSKTPKPGKENVQESMPKRSASQERLKSVEMSSMKVQRDRSPAKAASPIQSPPAQESDFKRNQFAYSSMTRMVTPSYIPASQYVKKSEEIGRSQPQPIEENPQEWNGPIYATTTKQSRTVVESVTDSRPTQLPLTNGRNNLTAPIGDGDADSQLHSPPGYIDLVVTLRREEAGFGFRIVGGREEGTQVYVGYVVPGGAAERDGRLEQGDEILNIDGVNVINAEHGKVIQMMQRASQIGHVVLGVRRKINYTANMPMQVTISKQPHEGFGFVIISSVARNQQIGNGVPPTGMATSYPTLGRILPNSPAYYCGQLHVGDKILAVNGIDVLHLHHSDIVQMIKESGTRVTLTIEPGSGNVADDTSTVSANSQQRFEEYQAGQETNGYGQFGPAVTNQAEYHSITLERGTRGFGFSIRGGKEFQMPLYVLRIADNGTAAADGRLQVGDEIIEINGVNTKDFTHSEAIDLIKRGEQHVRLLVRRSVGGDPRGTTDVGSPQRGFSAASLPMSPGSVSAQYNGAGYAERQYFEQGQPTSFSQPASFSQPTSFSSPHQINQQPVSFSYTGSRVYAPRYQQLNMQSQR